MNMKKTKTYSGQAIAIIMVVLVVATVIGASLYSRMIKNRGALVESKESTRAMTQADTLLDFAITSDLAKTQDYFDTCIAGGVCEFTSLDQYTEGFGEALAPEFTTQITDWCEDIKITVEYADIESHKDYGVGDVMALKVGGLGMPADCPLTLGFKSVGETGGEELFTIKRVYMDVNGNVKPYEEDDMLLYCYTSSGDCGAPVAPKDSIIKPYFTSGADTLEINMTETKVSGGVTYTLYEIRVLPLYGKLGISTEPAACADLSLFNYKVTAKVTCSDDITRAMEVVIPNVNNLGYHAMFDYTIYNSQGVLQPN